MPTTCTLVDYLLANAVGLVNVEVLFNGLVPVPYLAYAVIPALEV